MNNGKKYHVLVTRPQPQAQVLCRLIEQQGNKATALSTIEITGPADKAKMIADIEQINQYDIAIFISANAVNYAAPYWPTQKTANLQIFAIGPATAQALIHHGIPLTALPKKYNSTGLLALPYLKTEAVQQKKIAIFAGAGGKQQLINTLQQRGAKAAKIICYQRQRPSARIQHPLSIDMIVSTSTESLDNLVAMTEKNILPWLYQIPLIVISPNIRDAALRYGFQHIVLSENASHNAILKTLQTCYSNQLK